MSRKDFAKCIGIAIKQLGGTRFWLRRIIRREWIPAPRLAALLREADEIKLIFGSILSNMRRNDESGDGPPKRS